MKGHHGNHVRGGEHGHKGSPSASHGEKKACPAGAKCPFAAHHAAASPAAGQHRPAEHGKAAPSRPRALTSESPAARSSDIKRLIELVSRQIESSKGVEAKLCSLEGRIKALEAKAGAGENKK
jgi:hypothetical protein